ncbi:hypothetical protein KIH86_15015 [Paenibacillus sp. HN-1]|uniref:hypothetical protein n=1 Tax=Paenibacillus TaxID=44249 RepID=UPI001CA9A4E3|nr:MULTISPECIES: hypothetical protein [Paenibacillus]MBY9080515.1 hypothetical protein [Paenibacillus sp. CGMCC 1.18879]MBY9085540.1 hypothetical protein [Paenibacillus sinensis]
MKIRHKTYVMLLLSTFAVTQLAGPGGPVVYAAETGAAVTAASIKTSTLSKLCSITLGAGLSVKLDSVNLFAQDGGNILTYTLTYTNTGGSSISMADYFSKVVTPGGSVIKGAPVTADASKKKIAAKSSQTLTYYVNVGSITAAGGLKIQMFGWNFNLDNFEQRIGTFTVPANFSVSALQGESKKVTWGSLPANLVAGSLQTYSYNGKLYAKVAVAIRNLGNQALTDPGYTLYLKSSGGSIFKLSLDQDSQNYKVQPGEKETVYYLAEIPAGMKTSGMSLQAVKLDSTLNVYLPVVSFELPAGASANLIVQNYAIKRLTVDGTGVDMQLQSADVYADNDNGVWTLQLHVKNAGSRSVTLPDYELAVKSSEGYLFPIDSSALAGLTLKPLEEKVLSFTVSVPLKMDQSKLKIQLITADSTSANSSGSSSSGSSTSSSSSSSSGSSGATSSNASASSGSQGSGTGASGGSASGGSSGASSSGTGTSSSSSSTGTSTTVNLPIAYFNIPYSLQTNTIMGSEYTIKNNYGSFAYSLASLQRLPWGDKDAIVAKLNIRNTSSGTVTLPDLTGIIKADRNDLTATTQLVNPDGKTTLASGDSASLYVLADIPYTTDISQIKVILNTKTDSATFLSLATTSAPVKSVQPIAAGGAYEITTPGKKASVQELTTKVYPGTRTNVVYSEVLMTNEETRQTDLSRLYGYFKTADGGYYEATVNQASTATSPGGKTLVTFTGKIPASIDTADIQLYVGQSVKDGALADAGAEATGYINVNAIPLTLASITPLTSLTDVALFPYNLNVINSTGSLNQNTTSISLEFKYSLTEDASYDYGTFDHKLIMQFTDPYGQVFEKTLTPGTDLTAGTNNVYTANFNSSLYKSLGGGTYRIALYDEYQGQRIELAYQNYSIDYVTVLTTSSSGSDGKSGSNSGTGVE